MKNAQCCQTAIKWSPDIFKECTHLGTQHWSLSLAGWRVYSGYRQINLGKSELRPGNPYVASIAATVATLFTCSSCQHWGSDDGGWLSTCVHSFSVSSLVHVLWWALTCTIKTFTQHDNSSFSIHMSLTQISLFPIFPSASICHCPQVHAF